MRYPVEMILDLLSSEVDAKEILVDYPDLERLDIDACLAYAARLVHTHSVVALAS